MGIVVVVFFWQKCGQQDEANLIYCCQKPNKQYMRQKQTYAVHEKKKENQFVI